MVGGSEAETSRHKGAVVQSWFTVARKKAGDRAREEEGSDQT